jgi:hypothetical protein
VTLEGEPRGLSVSLRAAEEGLAHAKAEVERLGELRSVLRYAQRHYSRAIALELEIN